MRIKFFKSEPPPSLEDIALVEDETGLQLPEGYLEFLKKFHGGTPCPNMCAANQICGISYFLSLSEIVEKYFLIGNEYEADYLPFAYAEGGNYVCFLVGKEDCWPVYFLDHETQKTVKLAKSFEEFIDSLLPIDVDSISLPPEDIRQTWISSDFLKKTQESR